ncbi:MAG: DUF523 domain-containing protein [Planctomycetia bacterium]|jgi:uncharacterized protein YbbK (DUF523 family)
MSERVLVSACLVGTFCRYDARTNLDHALLRQLAAEGCTIVPFCPEEAGGLATPRPAASLHGGDAAAVLDGAARVVDIHGRDVTAEFLRGAMAALEACRAQGIVRAYLKERSPSCGTCATHVEGATVPGPGVTTALLRRHGVECAPVEGRKA